MNVPVHFWPALHPSLRGLLHQQRNARLKKVLRGFRSPRRLVLSFIAVALGILWIGQTIAGIFMRESADPQRLQNWIAVVLTGYAIWNLLKVSFRKPVEPFEWTAAEKEWLAAAPMPRAQLVRYRISSISAAAMVKAAIFALVMIPDLTIIPLGFVCAYIGLMMIELFRAGLEIILFSLTRREKSILRIVVGTATCVMLISVGSWYLQLWQASQFREVFSIQFVGCTLRGLQSFPDTTVGKTVCGPFHWLAGVMLAKTISLGVLAQIATGGFALLLAMRLIEKIEAVMSSRSRNLERIQWPNAVEASETKNRFRRQQVDRIRRNIPRLGGIGSLVWRQFLGANQYRGTLAISLIVPLALALAPALGADSGWKMVQQIIVLIGCYSFLLLPTALKFDFRRDLDRICVLKAMPMSPLAITAGQLAVPVVVTSCFQLFAFLSAMAIHPYHPGLLMVAMFLLVPFNVFVFGLENLMFLLYPYRVSEEGIQIFLRTILAFTAKGFLMATGLAVGAAGLLLCLFAGRNFAEPQIAALAMFTVSAGVATCLVATAVVWVLARVFAKLDPSEDLASVQF